MPREFVYVDVFLKIYMVYADKPWVACIYYRENKIYCENLHEDGIPISREVVVLVQNGGAWTQGRQEVVLSDDIFMLELGGVME